MPRIARHLHQQLLAACAIVSPAAALPAQQAPDWRVLPQMSGSAWFPGFTYDAARERVVMVDGPSTGSWSGSRTWEWDGATWEARNPVHTPPVRELGGLCYDPVHRRSVLFDAAGETWLWDGSDWTQATPTTTPAGRLWAGMAYDLARQRLVLFGGSIASTLTAANETWEWDGTDWTRRTPATSPPPMISHGMAYDAARQRVVAFGGAYRSPNGTVWEYDGTTWVPVPYTGGPSSANWFDVMAYDAARQRCVYLSAYGSWEWDGAAWTPIPIPAGSNGTGGAAYDLARGETVVFSGEVGSTWTWDGALWKQVASSGYGAVFGDYSGARLATDSTRRRIVSFGATGYDPNLWFRPDPVTREWDGLAWIEQSPATSPTATFGHALFFDDARGLTVMWSGSLQTSETWSWDGVDWTLRQPTAQPGPRFRPGVAFDTARGRGVLFGGRDANGPHNDTWEWDGATWRPIPTPTSPPARSEPALAYDAARQRVVLFGGADAADQALADTWEWNGTVWRTIAPATRPPGRIGAGTAWDASRQRVVMHGGFASAGALTDTWEWDGADWQPVVATRTPPAAFRYAGGPALAYDPVRDAVFVSAAGRAPWLLSRLPAAASSSSGTGCGGPGGAPTLSSTEPRIGNDAFQFEVGGSSAGTSCVVVLSPFSQSTPVGGGCTLHVTTFAVPIPGTSNQFGHAIVGLPIPFDASLRGRSLFAQAAALDPNGPLGGLALTGLRTLTFGD